MSETFEWTGRRDGDGPEHRRFFDVVREPGDGVVADTALVGFASDEGVRRNRGRPGAVDGPRALREALASLAVHDDLTVVDHGDVTVDDGDLDDAQRRLSALLERARRDAPLTVALGGGHETAYGSHLGLGHGPRLGVLNLDAHFDLRQEERASSGTPFLQIAEDRRARGLDLRYAVVGVSEASNTDALFARAEEIGTTWLVDDDCQQPEQPLVLVERFLEQVDEVHLSVDLDVLPAADAPGVSAPAALGVPTVVVQRVCDAVVDSGRLVHLDIAELNPRYDVDARTARVGARLAHRVITRAARRRRQT